MFKSYEFFYWLQISIVLSLGLIPSTLLAYFQWRGRRYGRFSIRYLNDQMAASAICAFLAVVIISNYRLVSSLPPKDFARASSPDQSTGMYDGLIALFFIFWLVKGLLFFYLKQKSRKDVKAK